MTPDELEQRAPGSTGTPATSSTSTSTATSASTWCSTCSRSSCARHPRADHRSVIVHFANSTEEQVGAHRPARRDRQRQPVLPRRLRRQVRRGRPRPGARRRHGAGRLGARSAGMPLSFHSDLPMGPSAPLYLAWCAVNRITPSGRVAGPGAADQRRGRRLRAVTIEAAYSWRKEDGSAASPRARSPTSRCWSRTPSPSIPDAEGHPDLGHGLRGSDFPGLRPQVRRRQCRVARPGPAVREPRGPRPCAHRLPVRSSADGGRGLDDQAVILSSE